ncbi:chaperonin 10-like protein [Mycena metata]|uniref:Chaperonin 10-like protein n=1 Tax=Mycena metata TaxID=1033252 RepID=A0AAD7NW14_9AGAR|nr:chaperonin 10-like protein [Mycena metata]
MASEQQQQQKALAITAKGGPWTLIAIPIPEVERGNLLVRVEGAGLNPAHWKFQTGVVYPAFFGSEGAGTVVEVGEDVTGFEKGDRVLFQGKAGWFNASRNTFQEYALVDADLTAKLPQSISCLQGAAIPIGLTTAAFGLCQAFPDRSDGNTQARGGAGLKAFWEPGAEGCYAGEGKTILVLGGASVVGQYCIQIARYMGFSRIIVTASLKHETHLRGLGATHVVDRYADTGASLRTLEDKEGLKLELVFDAVHAAVTQAEVDLLAPNGTLVSAGPLHDELLFEGGRRATAIVGSVHIHRELGKEMNKRLGGILEAGVIKPVRVEKLSAGLAGVADGLDRMLRGQVSGTKLVVNPTETRDVV